MRFASRPTTPSLLTLLAMTLAVLANVSGGSVARGDQRPNIVFCMADDLGYGDVGYLGHPVLQTPAIDAMAAGGLRLDRFYSASPVCSPTRASVLTGRHPNRCGVFRWGNALRPQERTVATRMTAAGYRSGFFGKWHLGAVRAGRPTNPGAHGFQRWCAAANFFMNDPWMSCQGEPVQLFGEGSMVTVEKAIEFIRESSASEQPFVAFVWFGSPHIPHQATDELKSLYPDQPEQLQNYYGEITGIDRAIGRLREELRDLGIAEQTLLMFTSDNGGRPQDGADHRGLRGRKSDLWEGGIRVPAVIEWPGKVAPRISEVPAGTVDLFPTMLELADAAIPTDRPLDGISLLPLLEDRVAQRPRPLAFWDYPQPETKGMKSDQIIQELKALIESGEDGEINEGILHTADQPWDELDDYPGWAVWMDNAWKLHRLPNQRFQLYNLERDPGEQQDVSESHPEIVDRMRAALRAWEDSVVRSVRGADY